MKDGKTEFTTDDFENGSSEPGFTTTTQAALCANALLPALREQWLADLLKQVERQQKIIDAALEECGPPKMSESLGTLAARIKGIKAILRGET